MFRKITAALSKILLDPRVIITGVVSGFLVGIFCKSFGTKVAPYGIIYIALLSMCILPMMTTAIISGLGDMLKSQETRGKFNKMILIYALGLLIPGLVGIAAALIGRPGVGLELQDLSKLGETILSVNQNGHSPQSLISFVGKVVPHNVFAAFSEGRIISIVFVSILIGMAMGLLHAPKSKDTLSHIRVAYEAFELIFTWLICLLPLGLFCLLAGLMAHIDFFLLRALIKYLVIACLTVLLLLIAYHILLWRLSGVTLLNSFKALKSPLLLAFITNNSIITIPSCMATLHEDLAVDRRIAELLVPFGMIANRHGVVFLFAYTVVFLMQLYGLEMDFNMLSITFLSTILSGMAAEGHGAAIAPLLSDVLKEISVPAVLAPTILTVTFPILGRLENLLTIYATSILSVWVGASPGSITKKLPSRIEEK